MVQEHSVARKWSTVTRYHFMVRDNETVEAHCMGGCGNWQGTHTDNSTRLLPTLALVKISTVAFLKWWLLIPGVVSIAY